MKSRWPTWLLVALILGGMGWLMWRPIAEDSATIDEPEFIASGYSYWQGQGYRFNVEHPPLGQLWNTVPTLWMNVKVSPAAEHYWEHPSPVPYLTTWKLVHHPRVEFVGDIPRFYHYPNLEAAVFAVELLFRSGNDANQILFWCRCMQALLALATGLVIFLWARALSNDAGGILALLAWAMNPLALAYGHIVATDGAIALTSLLAVWTWVRFLQKPALWPAVVAGLCLGLALLTKYTALIWVPILILLAVIHAWQRKSWRDIARYGALAFVVSYLTILAVYLPYLTPPPPIDPALAIQIGVPGWFQTLRPILIPGDYFRGVAIMLGHAANGHDSYLLGQWSLKGWWYYYPLAILWKTPVALLLLIAVALVCLIRHRPGWIPLLAGGLFLAFAMTNKANIGIRHILPLFPMLAVFVGAQLGLARRSLQLAGWVLCGWLVIVALQARPRYLAYFNEIVGGSRNGRHYLLDSNLDWGQDAKRLRAYMTAKGLTTMTGDYFGVKGSIGYYQIPFIGLPPSELSKVRGSLVAVSVHRLMKPEYAWLRDQYQLVDIVGDSIYIYWLP